MRKTSLALASASFAVLLAAPLVSVAVDGHHGRAAATAVTIGSTEGALVNNCGDIALLMGATGPSSPSWNSPIDGVITSWKHGAGPNPGSVRLLVVRPSTSTPGGYDVMAKSANQPITTGAFNTFAGRIPITAGQQLALDLNPTGTFSSCGTVGGTGDVAVIQGAFDSDNSSVLVPNTGQPGIRVNLSAVVEPDVDHDAFGDISQDLCPESAATQAACPAPDTTVTKAPKRKGTKRKVTIAFASTQPGATFSCAVDGKAAVACTSPFRTKVTYGKHTVVVTAVNEFGVPDPTPTTVSFRVRRP